MVTSSPTIVGWVLLVTWIVVRSWTLVRAPMRMWFTSPRSTQPNQIEERSPISTSPSTTAPLATNTLPGTMGVLPPNGRMIGISAADASPRPAARQADDQGRPEDGPGRVGRPVERIGVATGDEGLVELVRGAVEAGHEDGDPERPTSGQPRRAQRAGGEDGQQGVRPGVEDLVEVRDRGRDRERPRLVGEDEDQRRPRDRGPARPQQPGGEPLSHGHSPPRRRAHRPASSSGPAGRAP